MWGITRGFRSTDRDRSQSRSREWTLKSWPCHCSESPANYLVRASFFFKDLKLSFLFVFFKIEV